MGALKRSQCGSVVICPTNDHVVLQAHPSWQDYSKKPKDIYVQIELSEQGKVSGFTIVVKQADEENKLPNRC